MLIFHLLTSLTNIIKIIVYKENAESLVFLRLWRERRRGPALGPGPAGGRGRRPRGGSAARIQGSLANDVPRAKI